METSIFVSLRNLSRCEMTESFFKEIKEELRSGLSEKGHPFRYFTLGTVGLDRMARLRTVVLRKLSGDMSLTFFTDARSKKIIHIKENNKVSLLFYHPEKMLQLKVEGLAKTNRDPTLLKKYWSEVNGPSKKDYTTALAPGSRISDPDTLDYLDAEDYFCAVEVNPHKIEYLKLKRPNHVRIRFSRTADGWKSEFLVP